MKQIHINFLNILIVIILSLTSCGSAFSDAYDAGYENVAQVSTIAGSTQGFTQDIDGIAYQQNALYICDSNGSSSNKIMKISLADGSITSPLPSWSSKIYSIASDGTTLRVGILCAVTYINSGTLGIIAGDFFTSGYINSTGPAARFYGVRGITTYGTNIYVSDSNNQCIRIIPNSLTVDTFAGSLSPAVSDYLDAAGTSARFDQPMGITTDGTFLYVCDSYNNSIRKITIASPYTVTTLAGNGPSSYGFTDGIGTAAKFNMPHSIVLLNNCLFISDFTNNAIRKIDLNDNSVTTIAGAGSSNPGFKDGIGTEALFKNPRGITTDGESLYISDSGNSAIRKIEFIRKKKSR
jgi:hypothetical protein